MAGLYRGRFVYKVVQIVCYIALTWIIGLGLLLILQIICYLSTVYNKNSGEKETECLKKILKRKSDYSEGIYYMPKHIHQIYFSINDRPLPKIWEIAQDTWKDDNPEFIYTLWNSQTFYDFISVKYPDLVSVYNNYSHWISQIDMAKLLILYHFGGIYIDTDVRSRQPLVTLYSAASGRYETLLYRTQPIGVASDFIMSSAESQYLAHAICGLKSAQRQYISPYVTSMLSTGPLYLYVQYLTYKRQSDVKLVNPKVVLRYVRHIDGGTWHGWDGAVIWWLFVKRNLFLTTCIILFAVYILCRFFKRTRCRIRPIQYSVYVT